MNYCSVYSAIMGKIYVKNYREFKPNITVVIIASAVKEWKETIKIEKLQVESVLSCRVE